MYFTVQSYIMLFVFFQNLLLQYLYFFPYPRYVLPMDLKVMLEGSYLKEKQRPSLLCRYVLKQNLISPEFGEPATPAFWLMDLDDTYSTLRLLAVSGEIRNLFEMTYYEHLNCSISETGYSIYNPSRNIYLRLTACF